MLKPGIKSSEFKLGLGTLLFIAIQVAADGFTSGAIPFEPTSALGVAFVAGLYIVSRTWLKARQSVPGHTLPEEHKEEHPPHIKIVPSTDQRKYDLALGLSLGALLGAIAARLLGHKDKDAQNG